MDNVIIIADKFIRERQRDWIGERQGTLMMQAVASHRERTLRLAESITFQKLGAWLLLTYFQARLGRKRWSYQLQPRSVPF